MERVLPLLRRSRALGFLGPGPISRHVASARDFAAAARTAPRRALDLGSGGGVPGLVLAEIWPASTWVLLDSNARRTGFLREAVAELGWSGRTAVLTARAEDAGRAPELRFSFDLVVARSFGPPSAVAECGAPFLRVGGRLVVSEPPTDDIKRWPASGLEELGLLREEDAPVSTHRMATMLAVRSCPPRYPRRPGIPAKRPLF